MEYSSVMKYITAPIIIPLNKDNNLFIVLDNGFGPFNSSAHLIIAYDNRLTDSIYPKSRFDNTLSVIKVIIVSISFYFILF